MCLNVRVNVIDQPTADKRAASESAVDRESNPVASIRLRYVVANSPRGTTALSPRHRAGLLGESARLSRLRRKLSLAACIRGTAEVNSLPPSARFDHECLLTPLM